MSEVRYKTHQGAVLSPDGRGAGAWYVELSADGLMVAGGSWRLESDQVERLRRAVADDVQGARLQKEVDRLTSAGYRIGGETVTRVPSGYAADAPRMELLKHKSLNAARRWDPDDWLHDRRALEMVRDAWREFAALNAWLADNVGATAKEPRRR